MPSNRNNKKAVYGSISFDSQMELSYYLELLRKRSTGHIEAVELQPRFILQPAFEKNGVKYRPIEYRADFKVTYADGRVEVCDVKGFEDAQFKIKRKLFEYTQPDFTLKLITQNPKKYGGGWIEVDELKRLRKQSKQK